MSPQMQHSIVSASADGLSALPPTPRRPSFRIAAGLLVLLLGLSGVITLHRAREPLPPYHLLVGVGSSLDSRALRDASSFTAPLRLSLDSTLSLILRPRQPVRTPLLVRAALHIANRHLPWRVEPLRTPSGAYVLRARVRDLPDLGTLDTKSFRISFELSRPQGPHGPAQLPARLWNPPAQTFEVAVELVPL